MSIWIPNMHVCILVLSAHLVVYMRCDCTCVHLRVRVSVWHTSTILMVVHMMFPFPVHVRSFPLFPPTSASRHVLRAFALSLSLPIFLACSRSRSHTHTHTHTHSLSHTNAPTFSYTLIHAHTRTHTHTSYTRHIPAWSHTERDKTPGIYDLKLVCWGVFACKEMRIHTNKQMPYTHWNLSVEECLHTKKCAYTRTNIYVIHTHKHMSYDNKCTLVSEDFKLETQTILLLRETTSLRVGTSFFPYGARPPRARQPRIEKFQLKAAHLPLHTYDCCLATH